MRHSRRSNPTEGGFSLLGMLIVIVIIAILSGYYFSGDDESSGVPGYYKDSAAAAGLAQGSIQRARNVAQDQELRTLDMNIEQWAMNNPGERATIEKLRAAGMRIPNPPAGHHYEIDENNKAALVQDAPGPGQGIPVPSVP